MGKTAKKEEVEFKCNSCGNTFKSSEWYYSAYHRPDGSVFVNKKIKCVICPICGHTTDTLTIKWWN